MKIITSLLNFLGGLFFFILLALCGALWPMIILAIIVLPFAMLVAFLAWAFGFTDNEGG